MHCHVTMDLEDYRQGIFKEMGISGRPTPAGTERGVAEFLETLSRAGGSPRATFFTTGQVGRDQPQLVRRLSDGGHEIACHSNNHDNVSDLGPRAFRDDLTDARRILEDTGGGRVIGFRAPNFSMEGSTGWAVQILGELGFRYDSSLVVHGRSPVPDTGPVREFPIVGVSFGGIRIRVIGGTFFRLLPAFFIINLLKKVAAQGHVPIIYLHPHDLNPDNELINVDEMTPLPRAKAFYWRLKQELWTTGNRTVSGKLQHVLGVFPNAGPLEDVLEA